MVKLVDHVSKYRFLKGLLAISKANITAIISKIPPEASACANSWNGRIILSMGCSFLLVRYSILKSTKKNEKIKNENSKFIVLILNINPIIGQKYLKLLKLQV